MSILRPIDRTVNRMVGNRLTENSVDSLQSVITARKDIAGRPAASRIAMRILAKSLVRDLQRQGYAERDIVSLSSELISMATDQLARS